MSDAALGNEMIREVSDVPSLSLQHRHLHAALMIEMHVQGRDGHVVMIMEAVRQPLRQLAHGMVVHVDEGGDAMSVGMTLGRRLLQPNAREIANRLRSVLVAAHRYQPIKFGHQGFIDSDGYALHEASLVFESRSDMMILAIYHTDRGGTKMKSKSIPSRLVPVTRRKVLRGAGGLLLAAPGILSARGAVAKSVLNVTAYDGFIPPAFKRQFETETGIEVRVRLASSQAPELNLLVAERASPLSDICTVSGNRIHQFFEAQVIEPLDVSRLANWRRINPLYTESDWIAIDGAVMAMPLLVGANVLVYNSKKVNPAPESWGAMFDSRYKGRIAYVIEDFLQCTMLYQGADGTFAAYIDKPDEAARAVNAARDLLIEHKSQVLKFYEDGNILRQLLIGEDVVLAQAYAGTLAKLIIDGLPIRLTIPREGSISFVYNFALIKNAANRDNAYRFLDAMLAYPEIGAQLTRAAGYTSTFLGAEKALTELERQTFMLTPDQLSRLRFLSYKAQALSSRLVDRAVAEVEAG